MNFIPSINKFEEIFKNIQQFLISLLCHTVLKLHNFNFLAQSFIKN